MRPYVIEIIFAFAAGCCVGAYLNERTHSEEITEGTEEPVKERTIKIHDATISFPKKKHLLF